MTRPFFFLLLPLILLFTTTYSQTSTPGYVSTTGLIGWWPFNGNANDESGGANNGTVSGPTLTTDRFNVSSKAYQFNGGADLICTTNSFNAPNTISYSAWFKTTANLSNGPQIVGFNRGRCAHDFQWDRVIAIDPDELIFYTFPTTAVNNRSNAVLNDGQWHHVAVTMGQEGSKVYLDGQLKQSNPNQTVGENFNGYFRIGGLSPNDVNNSLIGSIDDVGIWNRVLSPIEIGSLYRSSSVDLSLTTSSVSENMPVGTTVGTFTPTSGTYTYTLVSGVGDQDNSSFTINGSTLKTAAVFNAVAKSVYSIRVRSTDGNGVYFDKSFSIHVTPGQPFITVWKTDNVGATANNQILFPGTGANYLIEWESKIDSQVKGSATASGPYTLLFPAPGIYKVKVTGGLQRFHFEPETTQTKNDRLKLISVEQWGSVRWTTMSQMFLKASNFQLTATDQPDLSLVTDMSSMFEGASNFNAPIGNWNVSGVTNMSRMFFLAGNFWPELTNWDVSSVTNMSSMFESAFSFNSAIGNWNVSNVTTMSRMFSGANSFNQDINTWNVSSVTNMSSMFENAARFNKPLSAWNLSSVTLLNGIFRNAGQFNQNLGAWNISSVTNIQNALDNSGLSIANYESTLAGWSSRQSTPRNLNLGAATLEYQNVNTRNLLVNNFGWTISGDVFSAPPTDISFTSTSTFFRPPVGTRFGNLTAADNKPSLNSFTLVAGVGDTDNGTFTISGSSIYTNALIDPAKSSYTIRVKATDFTNLTFEKSLTILTTSILESPGPQNYFIWENVEGLTDIGVDKSNVLNGTSTPFYYSGQWGDFNNDGAEDLFVAGFDGESKLFKNTGNKFFVEQSLGVNANSTGRNVTWADYNNDGLLDYFAPSYGNSSANADTLGAVFKNLGNGSFQRIPLGVYSPSSGTWADTDNDGDLDLVANGTTIGPDGKWRNYDDACSLFRNDGNDQFTQVCNSISPDAWTPIFVDLNNDRLLDLFNISDAAPKLFLAKGNNQFELNGNSNLASLLQTSGTKRGLSFGDIDNDGDYDAFFMSQSSGFQEAHRFYINDGAGTFTLKTSLEILGEELKSGRGSVFFDFDNDGDIDLLCTASAQWRLFRNNGNLNFTAISSELFKRASNFSGGSVADYDNDGFLDFFSGNTGTNFNGLYRNKGNVNGWIQIQLQGKKSNRNGIGAKIDVYAAGSRRHHQVLTTNGFANQNSLIAHFGLANASTADSIIIRWPSGIKQKLLNVQRNQKLLVVEQTNTPAPIGERNQLLLAGSLLNDFKVNGQGIKWYSDSLRGNTVSGSSVILENEFYYASQTINGIESVSRLAVKADFPHITVSDSEICPGGSVELSDDEFKPLQPNQNKVGTFSNNRLQSVEIIYPADAGYPISTFAYDFWFKPERTITLLSEKTGGVNVSAVRGQNIVLFPGFFSLNNSGYRGSGISVGTNGISVIEHSGNFFDARLTVAMDLTGWHHCTVVYTNNDFKLFVDGNLVGQKVNGSNFGGYGSLYGTVALKQTIGQGYYQSPAFPEYDPNDNYTGKVDELRHWNVALTDQQVSTLYKKKLVGNQLQESTLHISFDDGATTNLAKAVPNILLSSVQQHPIVTEQIPTVGAFYGNSLSDLQFSDLSAPSSYSLQWSNGSKLPKTKITAWTSGYYWLDFTLGTKTVRDSILITVTTPQEVLSAGNNLGTTSTVLVDKDGNQILTGTYTGQLTIAGKTLSSIGGTDIFLAKFDGCGSLLWIINAGSVENNDNPGSNRALAIDSENNIYWIGRYSQALVVNGNQQTKFEAPFASVGGTNNTDGFLVKISPSGEIIWGATIRGGSNEGFQGMTIDSQNNILVTGDFNGCCSSTRTATFYGVNGNLALDATESANASGFLLKINSSGNPVWKNSAFNLGVVIGPVATDGLNNIYVSGSFSSLSQGVPAQYIDSNGTVQQLSNASTGRSFILKVNGSGIWQWGSTFNTTVVSGLAIDQDGNPWIAGHYIGSSITFNSTNNTTFQLPQDDDYAGYLIKYSKEGSPLLAKKIDISTGQTLVSGLIYSDGALGVVGSFSGINNGLHDIFFSKHDALGEVVSLNTAGGPGYDYGASVSLGGPEFIISAGVSANANVGSALIPATTTVVWRKSFPDNRQKQEIDFPDFGAVKYGDDDILLTAISSGGLSITYTSSDPSVALIADNKIKVLKPGVVQITATQPGNGQFTPAISLLRTLTIGKAELTVTANSASRTYGASNPEFTINFDGFKFNDTKLVLNVLPTTSTSATLTTQVGKYAILVDGGEDDYYELNYFEGLLEITQASITAVVQNASRVYGDPDPVFTFQYEGLKNGDDASVIDTPPSVSVAATVTSTVGDYVATAKGGSDNNYKVVDYKSGTLTVKKAPLTVKANDQSRPYNQDNPSLTLTYVGLKNNETEAVLDQLPLATTTATKTTLPGTYSITVSGGADGNYELGLLNGVLTISKLSQALSFTVPDVLYEDESPYSLSATSSAGVAVKFALVEGPGSVFANILTISGPGQIKVKAFQEGTEIYAPAEVVKTITVPASFTLTGKITKPGNVLLGRGIAKLFRSEGGLAKSGDVVNGLFEIKLVRPGKYILQVVPQGNEDNEVFATYYKSSQFHADASQIIIEGSTQIEMELIPKKTTPPEEKGNGEVKGKVIAGSGGGRFIVGRIVEGVGVANVPVLLLDAVSGAIKRTATTDKDGLFVMTELPNGQYKLALDVVGASLANTSTSISITTQNPILEVSAVVGEKDGVPVVALEVLVITSLSELSKESLRAYPNPFREELIVEYHALDKAPIQFRMLDLNGRKVFDEQREFRDDNLYRLEFNLDQLSMGVYLLELKQGDRRNLVKVVR